MENLNDLGQVTLGTSARTCSVTMFKCAEYQYECNDVNIRPGFMIKPVVALAQFSNHMFVTQQPAQPRVVPNAATVRQRTDLGKGCAYPRIDPNYR